jgi:hypothetical protein
MMTLFLFWNQKNNATVQLLQSIMVFVNGKDAHDSLKAIILAKEPQPDIILLI